VTPFHFADEMARFIISVAPFYFLTRATQPEKQSSFKNPQSRSDTKQLKTTPIVVFQVNFNVCTFKYFLHPKYVFDLY